MIHQTEAEFQHAVCELATMLGWRWVHFRAVKDHRNRWMTPFHGCAGFTDLVLVHPDRGLLFVELKANEGRLTEDQKCWGRDLEAVGAEYHVWRPDDMNKIRRRLQESAK